MTDPSAAHLTTAAMYAVPALVWGVLTYNYVVLIRGFLPRVGSFSIFPVWSGLVTFIYLVLSLGELAEPMPGGPLHRLIVVLLVLGMVAFGATLRHLIVGTTAFLLTDETPARGWIARNYGSAMLAGTVVLLPVLLAGPPWMTSSAVATVYMLFMAALAAWQVRARIRSGPLRIGTLATQLHGADAAILAIVGLLLIGVVAVGLSGAVPGHGVDLVIAAVGVLGAGAPALRNLTAVVRGVLMTLATVVAAGALYLGAHAVGASIASPVLRRFVDLGAVLGLVAVLIPGRACLQGALDRLILRHSLRVREELQLFLRTLSPELGTLECGRRALVEAVRAWRFRGAAILLDDGTALVEGDLDLGPLRQVWPRGAAGDELPSHPFTWFWLRDPQLREALAAADVLGVLPIVSPRRRWGHMFTSIGLLGWDKSREQVDTGKMFCDQLALMLDGAELLARTVAVERSLAHAEKLAAIGETAARIAHDIRNPVTAARSLAQQLAREPESRFRTEHEAILAELERVERQVASLLRFARREEFHFAPVDLGALVRATVESFLPRLEGAGIAVELDVPGAVSLRADAEKLRQALINLIENAADALADETALRRLAVSVESNNGSVSIRVRDTGPGVPDDALPRIFEPFFSGKTNGTGLGLAIAKRTVDAHGGRIVATRPAGGGLELRLDLPVAGGERGRFDA